MNIETLLIKEAKKHGWEAVQGSALNGEVTITFKQPALTTPGTTHRQVKEATVKGKLVRYEETKRLMAIVTHIHTIDGRPPLQSEEEETLRALPR